jgi:RecJ-like exonuclease
MKFSLNPEELDNDRIDDYVGQCPACKGKTTFYHELKCKECNQTTITWCPRCEKHVEMQID